MFELCYTAHGGSGLGLSYADVLEMNVADAEWLLDSLGDRRRAEAKAMKPKK